MLIGISGKKGSGKDQFAGYLKSFYPEASKDQFARPIKEMVAALIGCDVEQLEDREFKETPIPWLTSYWVRNHTTGLKEFYPTEREAKQIQRIRSSIANQTLTEPQPREITPRYLLQTLGTQWGRDSIHPHIWVRSLINRLSHDEVTIITDLRFPNEARAIEENDGITIRINRPGLETSDIHESEIALDGYQDFDFVVENDGSLDDLSDKALEIWGKIKGRG